MCVIILFLSQTCKYNQTHFSGGIFETGTLLGCLRKIQGWNLSSILFEYRSFAGSLARSANERFIEVRIYFLPHKSDV